MFNGNRMIQGIVLAATAGTCWGSMGIAAQYLLHYCRFEAIDLVSLRLVMAGIMFLMTYRLTGGTSVLAPLKNKRDFFAIAFAGVTVLFSQLTFMLSIKASNAGTATIILMTVPLFCGAYLAFKEKRPLTIKEIICFLFAFIGVVLIVTRGDFSSLNFSYAGVAWALLSAVLSALYSIQPKRVIMKLGVFLVVGWGMLIGGLVSFVLNPPWTIDVDWNLTSVSLFSYILVFGTYIAFMCYMTAIKLVSPVIVGLLVCFEPLSAYILAILLYSLSLGFYESVGILLILANVVLLSLPSKRKA